MNNNTRKLVQAERDATAQQRADIHLAALEQALADATAAHEHMRVDFSDLHHTIAGRQVAGELNRLLADEKLKLDSASGAVAKAWGALDNARKADRTLQHKIALLDELLGPERAQEEAA